MENKKDFIKTASIQIFSKLIEIHWDVVINGETLKQKDDDNPLTEYEAAIEALTSKACYFAACLWDANNDYHILTNSIEKPICKEK